MVDPRVAGARGKDPRERGGRLGQWGLRLCLRRCRVTSGGLPSSCGAAGGSELEGRPPQRRAQQAAVVPSDHRRRPALTAAAAADGKGVRGRGLAQEQEEQGQEEQEEGRDGGRGHPIIVMIRAGGLDRSGRSQGCVLWQWE